MSFFLRFSHFFKLVLLLKNMEAVSKPKQGNPGKTNKMPANKINFIQRNIEMIKNQNRERISGNRSSGKEKSLAKKPYHGIKNTTATEPQRKPLTAKNFNNCLKLKHGGDKKSKTISRKGVCMENMLSKPTNKVVNAQRKFNKSVLPLTPQQKMHKKLVRRSINHRMTRKDNAVDKSQGNKRKSVHYQKKQIELQKKLNNYLVSKGKQPKLMKGFQPTKVVTTPKNSPARKPRQTSCWQGLRDEDSCDEILVLLRHMNSDVDNCITRNSNFAEILQVLHSLSKDHVAVKNYAQYWIMIIQVKECMGASCEDVVQVFEDAIAANAQPIADVQQRLVDFLENHKNKNKAETPVANKKETVKEQSPVIKSVSTSPFTFPDASATTPFVLRGTRKLGISPLVKTTTPSSVVKLKVIPQSSPIFKRMMSRNVISFDTSAIVTPVRRSNRIANSAKKSLKNYNVCLPSIADVVSTLQTSDQDKCEIVYQPNKALTDEMQSICTMLEF